MAGLIAAVNESLRPRAMQWPVDKIERRSVANLIPYAAEFAHILRKIFPKIFCALHKTNIPNAVFYPGLAVLIERALAEDPEGYGADYLSKWRDDLSTWLSRDLFDAAVDRGVAVRAPASNINYIAECDASGGRNDRFTAAISHRERDGKVVLPHTRWSVNPSNKIIRAPPAAIPTQNLSMAETNCAKWRRESVPVGLREKALEAPVYFHASVPI